MVLTFWSPEGFVATWIDGTCAVIGTIWFRNSEDGRSRRYILLTIACEIGHHGLFDLVDVKSHYALARAAGISLQYGHEEIGQMLLEIAVSHAIFSVARTAFPDVFNAVVPTIDYMDSLEDVIDWAVCSGNFDIALRCV